MKTKEDRVWESLLAQSAPTFVPELAPPFGFTTRVLAAVREEQQKVAVWDRVGRRAVLAALGAVAAVAVLAFAWQSHQDVDPAVRSLAMVENVQVL